MQLTTRWTSKLGLTLGLVLSCAQVGAQVPAPEYILAMTDESTSVIGDVVSVTISLDSVQGQALEGWQFGVCHSAEVEIVDVGEGTATLTANGGGPVGFYGELILPGGGFTIGVLVDTMVQFTLPPGVHELNIGYYETLSLGTASIDFCTLGNPPVEVALLVAPEYYIPDQVSGSIMIGSGDPFMRGDCNTDGAHDISDVIRGLGALFGAPAIPVDCENACDANDDGLFNLADMVYLLSNQFTGGDPPPDPNGACGPDPTDDSLDCDSYGSCP